jgi:kumamolisin
MSRFQNSAQSLADVVKRIPRSQHVIAVAIGVLGVVFVIQPGSAGAATPNPAVVTAAVPSQVSDGLARDIGPSRAAQTIRLAIGLQPPHMTAEQQYLNEIQDKSSPLFHQYLSEGAWTARFGPTVAAQQAVVSWAQQAGLTVTHLYPNRLIVDVSGSVGAIENALSVQLNNYSLKGKSFFANAADPVLPGKLSGIVQSIEGLSSLQTMFPQMTSAREPASPAYVAGPVVADGAHAAANGSRADLRAARQASRGVKPDITSGAYDPTDLYSSQAYDYNALEAESSCCNPLSNPGNSPAQTSIAIATFGAQQVGDMSGFQSQYPYLAYAFQEINIDGTPACCDAEGTLDLEWATAMANSFGASQSTAKVYLYDGANFNDATFTDMYNQMVSDNVARVFMTGWSCTENFGCTGPEMSTRDAIFSEMAGQGWTLDAASGDRGAYDDCSHLAVSFPASDPNVVGVGGTDLSLGSGPIYNSEVGWSGGPDGCGGNDGGSGGGCSSVFAAPSYQSNEPCGSGSRAVPDISLNGDWVDAPQNFYFDGALSGTGGTPLAAAELAGFFAQEDSYLLAEGNICGSGSSACAPMGNANFPIYESGIDGAPHNPFYDITSGCNTNNIGTGYCAGTGYDRVTGWGSANMLQLAWAFNWHLFADDGRPVVNFTGPSSNVWYNTDQSVDVSVTDTGGGFTASGVSGFSVAWNSDPGDPLTEATPGSGGSFYSGPEYVKQTATTLDLASAGQGCNTVNVEAWDNMGLQSGDATDGPFCYDTVAPSITKAPRLTLRTHAHLTSTVPVTVKWRGMDATSGVNHYTLFQKTDDGSWTDDGTSTSPAMNLRLAPGARYRFKVSAIDNANNMSATSAGKTYTLKRIQEKAHSIAYSSGWKRHARHGASGGHVKSAKVAGKTATLSFKGIEVAWVSTKGSAYGSAKVKLGSRAAKTIHLHSPKSKTAWIVDVISGKSGAHKLLIKVLGSHAHPRVDVDAFVVLSG